jgi:hypothetical protein
MSSSISRCLSYQLSLGAFLGSVTLQSLRMPAPTPLVSPWANMGFFAIIDDERKSFLTND